MSIVVALAQSKLFAQLPAGEVASLGTNVLERSYAAGEEIFKEGQSGDGIYVVKDGLVEISALVSQHVRKVFSRIAAGDFFGEMAVLDYKPRSACAVAARDTQVYFVRQAAILKLLETSPTLSLILLQEISHRLREFNRQYIDEVLQAERLALVGRFARSIVHDLKNPLNVIGLSAEMAGVEKASYDTRRRATTLIRRQVERITDLVGEILEFTQGPSRELMLAHVDYRVFVEQLMEEARAEAQTKSVSLELGAPLPPVVIMANPKRLSCVFHNLMHNSFEAMPDGGKIVIRATTGPMEVVTEIEDTGPGIAPEIADRLFEAFATHGKPHGTGLGLSICRRIIEDHKGWISARTGSGRGAVFAFGLPHC